MGEPKPGPGKDRERSKDRKDQPAPNPYPAPEAPIDLPRERPDGRPEIPPGELPLDPSPSSTPLPH